MVSGGSNKRRWISGLRSDGMTKIKICGITNIEDGLAVAGLAVDYLGFIFYAPSSRYVEPERAAQVIFSIREELVDAAPEMIGVFVDESVEHICSVRKTAGLDGVQLSGDEGPEVSASLEPLRFRGLSLESLDRLGSHGAEAYLCDTHAPEQKGGTGKSYDYSRLKPFIDDYSIIVAGGLRPGTVGDVVSDLRPWGVDVSSAVESEPGRKDLDAVRTFVEAVRKADAEV